MCFLKPWLASEQAAWAVYRAALMKTHKIKQRQGFKSSQTPLFLYTYGQNTPLQWKVGCFSPQDFQATYWSVIMCFSLIIQVVSEKRWLSPGSQNKQLSPARCSSISTRGGELLLLSFSTHVPLQDSMALLLPHWRAIHFSYHPPIPDFLH